MEDSDEKTFINLIKQNADQNKIKSIIQTLYKKGNTDFINKYLSEKRTPLICIFIILYHDLKNLNNNYLFYVQFIIIKNKKRN